MEQKVAKRKDQREAASEDKISKLNAQKKPKASTWSLSLKKPSHVLEWERTEAPPVGTYNPRLPTRVPGLADFDRHSINRMEFYERRARSQNPARIITKESPKSTKRPDLTKLNLEEHSSTSENNLEGDLSFKSETKKSRVKIKNISDPLSTLRPYGYVDLSRQAPRSSSETRSLIDNADRFSSIPALVSR